VRAVAAGESLFRAPVGGWGNVIRKITQVYVGKFWIIAEMSGRR